MTSAPVCKAAGIAAATVLGGTGFLQDDVASVGHIFRFATQTDLVTHITKVLRTSADPRCPVIPSIPRY